MFRRAEGARERRGDREHRAPPRALGFWSLLTLGINGIVGVGIFFTPSLVSRLIAGPHGVWAYALTLLALLPVALAYARLGSRFDRDGGPYVWAQAAFGDRAGFVVGFAAYASAVLSTAAVFSGLAEYTAPALGMSAHPRLFSLTLVLVFALVVGAGLRPSAWAWSVLTVAKLVPLLLLIAVFFLGSSARGAASVPSAEPAWSRAVLLIVFPMQGFEIVPVPGGWVRSAARSIPLATLGSLLISAGLYMLLHWVCVRSVPALSQTEAPLVAAAAATGGARLAGLVRLGTDVSALGIAFGMMAMTPRYLSALGSPGADRGSATAERWLFAAQPGRDVPRRALVATLLLVAGLLCWAALARLFVLSSVAVLFQYSVSVIALGRLGLRREHGLTPRDALLAPLALGALLVVASAVERDEVFVLGGLVLLGILLGSVRVRMRR